MKPSSATPNGRELQATVAELRARKQETTLLLRCPGKTKESREADKVACETGLDKPNTDTHKLLKNPEAMLTGAKLNTLSQATICEMLRGENISKGKKNKRDESDDQPHHPNLPMDGDL